ncbi:phosphoadenosine phosphosulfate reductase domain-containing protein [Amantichitinum ursilacus]|uniref:Phosphoadenosine phosphosulphate reductase domain-containing protein n=1 Tax=Amantichitinum ursilacus TaxID=857265 RepID=A0A0N0XKN9_9NEIS|nr:phosphoadenosine phosphosulfate reductase family protein [Amantichitinum ursilacus]KPC52997.1 hypothetical protein WG78_10920 [Amantichitinum ursilacus]
MSIKHVISVSAGKDSTATLQLAIERFGASKVVAIFCDTGNEDEAVFAYLDYLERHFGIRIHRLRADFAPEFARKREFIAGDQRTRREYDTTPVFDAEGNPVPKRDGRGNLIMRKANVNREQVLVPVQKTKKIGGGRRVRWSNKAKRRALAALHPTGNPFLDLCMLKGRFPSRMAQFCTERLKRDLAVEFHMELMDQGHTVVSWQGVRRDESDARANVATLERVAPNLYIYRPIAAWTALEVFAYCAKKSIRPNPLYLQGFNRVGCMLCINAGKGEIRRAAARLPHHTSRLAEWETIVSSCSKRGYSTFFHKTDEKGSPAAIFSRSKIAQVIEWAKTTRGGRQYDLLAQAEEVNSCSSSYGLCDQTSATTWFSVLDELERLKA